MNTGIQNQTAIEAALGELRALLGERVTAAEAAREHHSHGESTHAPALPDLVCFPQSTEEVSGIVKVSARHGLAVVPFGAGTSLEGHVHALRGGISIDMRQMNRVLRVSVEDLDATVEAGIGRLQLTPITKTGEASTRYVAGYEAPLNSWTPQDLEDIAGSVRERQSK